MAGIRARGARILSGFTTRFQVNFHRDQPLLWHQRDIKNCDFVRSISRTIPVFENDDKPGIKDNPFYDKYADKIKKAQEEGRMPPLTPEEISRRMREETRKWKKHAKTLEQKFEQKKTDHGFAKGSQLPKSLNDIMKLEVLSNKSGQEIGEIWTDFHKNKDTISAVIPASTYDKIYTRAQECPTFIYPLPRDHGYEFRLAQFTGHQCYFTSLLNYQVYREGAPWEMNLSHYAELREEKGIVLMASEIDLQSLNIMEAQCLAQQLQMFYATADEERFNLVKTFNREPDKFKYMDLIKEIESSGLISPVKPVKLL